MRAILTAWTRSTGLPIETGCRARSTRRIESALDFASADYSLHAQTPQAPRYRSASRVGTSHQSARRLVCYASLVCTRRSPLIICISERSLLPVLVEARGSRSFIARFQEAVRSVLRHIGAASELLDSEAREMGQITIGATASRRVLGSLNDLASLTRFTMAERTTIDLTALAIELANTACSPINYETPRSVSLALLSRSYS